jgi:hypothetical protein
MLTRIFSLTTVASYLITAWAAFIPENPIETVCQLPDDPLIVPITPDALNQGWAMSVDQTCVAGKYCPYACQPGYYSCQWNPDSSITRNTMDGGLYCEQNGTLTKPFPDEPLCKPGLENVRITNRLDQNVSACQTVYPGNEEMLIPTVVEPGANVTLNVLPQTYWQGTSAQYYVNQPGTDSKQCVWGNPSEHFGNWAPFVFGAGQGFEGMTFISVRYNPNYETSGGNTSQTYNVRIECDDPNRCNGLPCQCERGICTRDNGCTVAIREGGIASFILYSNDADN